MSYWQLYLPKLPVQYEWMVSTVRAIIQVGLVLAAATVVRYRQVVRREWLSFGALGLFLVSLLVVIGLAGYPYRNSTGLVFEQVRYVFPLVGIYALGVVAACAAVGRKYAPVLSIAVIGLFAAHALSGVLLTLARYQG